MCGRYASVASRSELLEQFVVDEKYSDELRGQTFNVTPSKDNLRISEGKHAPTGW
jgi:putative SOS response-associated peptidase YedK